jgi:hypothetical protein
MYDPRNFPREATAYVGKGKATLSYMFNKFVCSFSVLSDICQ